MYRGHTPFLRSAFRRCFSGWRMRSNVWLHSTLTVPVLKLEYAEVVNDLEGTLKQACTFLDVPPAPFVHTTRKITSDQLSDSVTNLEELRALYQGTSFEWMFE